MALAISARRHSGAPKGDLGLRWARRHGNRTRKLYKPRLLQPNVSQDANKCQPTATLYNGFTRYVGTINIR